MKINLPRWLLAMGAGLVALAPAQSQSVVLEFLSGTSTTPKGPLSTVFGVQFFHDGDFVTQTFAGTGLPAATSARFQFTMVNYLTAGLSSSFDVLVNNFDVGDYVLTSTDANFNTLVSFDETYALGLIGGDTYTLTFRSKTEIPVGGGSYNWKPEGIATLSYVAPGGGTAPVPEPATWAMMIGGSGLVGGAMRRRTVKISYATA